MLIFFITLLVVSIISYCFLKNEFWENRFVVIFITVIVATIGNVIVSMSLKSTFPHEVYKHDSDELITMYVNDSIFTDSTLYTDSNDVVIGDTLQSNALKKCDVLLHDSGEGTKVFYKNSDEDVNSLKISEVYFKLSSDTVPTIRKHDLNYCVDDNIWVDFSLYTTIDEYYEISLSKDQYEQIPDSLINEKPY